MSGPKYGCAKLDMKKLRELQDSLSNELESTRCEILRGKIEEMLAETEKLLEENRSVYYTALLAEAENKLPESGNTILLRKQVNELNLLSQQEFSMEGNSPNLIVSLYVYEERKNKIRDLFLLMEETKAALSEEMSEVASSDSAFMSRDWKNKDINRERAVPELTEAYHNLLFEAAGQSNFSELKNSAELVMNNHSVEVSYKIHQLEALLEGVRLEKESGQRLRKRHQLENDFRVYSGYLGEEITVIPADETELSRAVEELKARIDGKLTAEYTAEALDSVLEKMGYDVLGSESVKGKNQEIAKKYYDFSDNSALNVSSSDNGSVLFEVMGKESDEPLSDGEKQAVKEDMDRFCPDFFKIREELAKLGVILEQERHFEADVRYVRGIDLSKFNKSDRREKREKKWLKHE